MVEFYDMGASLDKLVGKPFPKGKYPYSYMYSERDLDSERYELVSRRPDACNYVLLMRKADDHVLSWRYLNSPEPHGCKFQHVKQLM
jgi:hypothetical protein